MTNQARILAFAVPALTAIATAIAGFACSSDEPAPTDGSPLEIGTLVALSGDLSGTGTDNRDAQNLAVEQINAAGGVMGRPLRFLVEDDQTTTEGARAGYTSLIARKVAVIIGPSSSSQIVSIGDLIANSATPTIGRTSTSPLLTDLADGDFFFRVTPSDLYQAPVISKLVASSGVTRLCVANRDDTYGTRLSEEVIAKLPKSISVTRASYNPNIQDLSNVLEPCAPLLCATADGGAPCDDAQVGLLMITYVNDGLSILGGAKGWSGKKQKLFFTDGARDTELVKRGLGDVLEGARGTHPSGPDPTTAEGALLAEYRSAFLSRYGSDAPVFSENAFDAVYLAAAALEIAGPGANGAAIRDALRKTSTPGGTVVRAGKWAEIRDAIRSGKPIDYQGVTGDAAFDDHGDLKPPYYFRVWRIENGLSITDQIVKVTE